MSKYEIGTLSCKNLHWMPVNILNFSLRFRFTQLLTSTNGSSPQILTLIRLKEFALNYFSLLAKCPTSWMFVHHHLPSQISLSSHPQFPLDKIHNCVKVYHPLPALSSFTCCKGRFAFVGMSKHYEVARKCLKLKWNINILIHFQSTGLHFTNLLLKFFIRASCY